MPSGSAVLFRKSQSCCTLMHVPRAAATACAYILLGVRWRLCDAPMRVIYMDARMTPQGTAARSCFLLAQDLRGAPGAAAVPWLGLRRRPNSHSVAGVVTGTGGRTAGACRCATAGQPRTTGDQSGDPALSYHIRRTCRAVVLRCNADGVTCLISLSILPSIPALSVRARP